MEVKAIPCQEGAKERFQRITEAYEALKEQPMLQSKS